MISAAAIVITGQIGERERHGPAEVPAYLPMLLPFAVLLLPLLDMALAVLRRVGQGKSPFPPRTACTCTTGCSRSATPFRRSVAIMYVWTSVFAFGVAALVVWSTTAVTVAFGVGVLVDHIITLGPLRDRTPAPPLETP